MAHDDLYLECLRRAVKSWRGGVFDRDGTVAIMAWAIDIHMRQSAPEEQDREIRNREAVPTLELNQPLSVDDHALLDLYAEATTFWAAGYGKLKLIK